jgi:hypothetical protein
MLGPHTHRDNPVSRIMCAPVDPPVRCVTKKIGWFIFSKNKKRRKLENWRLLFCFFSKKNPCKNVLSDTSTSTGVKSTVIRTSVNIFEVSKRNKQQYFVDKVKDKRRTKNNNLEFIIG